MKNTCANCGKEYEFEPKRGTYKFKFCSSDCKHEFARKDSLAQTRVCEHCGKEYWWEENQPNYKEGKKTVDSKRFCSFKCGIDYTYTKVKQTYDNKSDEEKAVLANKTSQYFKRMTDEQRQALREKKKETFLEKYGVEHSSQSDGTRKKLKEMWKNMSSEKIAERTAKIKETNLERYGVEIAGQREDVKEKIRQTNIERYGTECVLASKEIRERIEQTNLEKYGHKAAAQNEEVKNKIRRSYIKKSKEEKAEIEEKRKKTNLERYGVEYIGGSEFVQEKMIATNMARYGAKRYMVSKEGRKQVRKTNLEKYGKEFVIQVPEFKEKARQTCLKRYGVEYNCLTPQCIEANTAVISKINLRFQEKLLKNGIESELEFIISPYSFDFKVGDVLIEIDPTYTHQSTHRLPLSTTVMKPKPCDYHHNKTAFAKNHGYRCIHIWDWDDEDKIVRAFLPRKTLRAEDLVIGDVTEKDAYLFLCSHCLEGFCFGQKVGLGLYTTEGELIELMLFGPSTYSPEYKWEILRSCTKTGFTVENGAKRLFEYFLEQYDPNFVIMCRDNSKCMDDVHDILGMRMIDCSVASKHWYNLETGRHITDELLRTRGYAHLHHVEVDNKKWPDKLLMLNDLYVEVFDCGKAIYLWEKWI